MINILVCILIILIVLFLGFFAYALCQIAGIASRQEEEQLRYAEQELSQIEPKENAENNIDTECIYTRSLCDSYPLEYRIVWHTEHHRKSLDARLGQEIIDTLNQYAVFHGFAIISANINTDHIDLTIRATPDVYIPAIVKYMKRASARILFKANPKLKATLGGRHLWDKSYLAVTLSEHAEQQVKNYLHSEHNT